MRTPINAVVVVLITVLVAMLGICMPAICAEQPQWKFSGDSLFKIYWQSTLRIANETDLSAAGMLGPIRLEGRARLTGSNWGIPPDAIVVGPWGERLDKWSVSAGMGGLSLQAGDTTVPVLSGLYLAGRSLYGAVVNAGGRLGSAVGTATGFYGVNAVSSGLSISTHKIGGAAAELSLSRNLGLTVQGMRALKGQFKLDVGGATAQLKAGPFNLNAEVAASCEHSSEDTGWTVIAGAQTSAMGGSLTLNGQYTSADFMTLNSAVLGTAGGLAEASATWSGSIWRGAKGANLHLGITGRLATDNVDGSLDSRTAKQAGEGTLTFRTGAGWVLKAKYVLAHEGSDEAPSPLRDKTNRVASLEATVPLTLAGNPVDVATRGSRATNVDNVSGGTDVLDTLALTGRATVGKTLIAAGAGWSQSVKSGSRKQNAEATLSLARPIIDGLLESGIDAKLTDSREFKSGSGDVNSAKDTLDAALWLKYSPRPWIEALAKLRANWGWYKPDTSMSYSDRYLEGQVRFRF